MPRQRVLNPFNPNAMLHQQQLLNDLFYIYTASFGSITTKATSTQNIPITTDADFIWCYTNFYGNDHSATEPFTSTVLHPFTLQINDGGISHGMFNNPVPVDSAAGFGSWPFILPLNYRFAAGATVSVTLVSLSANTWDNVYISLVGYKDFTVNQR